LNGRPAAKKSRTSKDLHKILNAFEDTTHGPALPDPFFQPQIYNTLLLDDSIGDTSKSGSQPWNHIPLPPYELEHKKRDEDYVLRSARDVEADLTGKGRLCDDSLEDLQADLRARVALLSATFGPDPLKFYHDVKAGRTVERHIDVSLIAVVGILAELSDVMVVPAWIAAGGLLPDVDATFTEEDASKGWEAVIAGDLSLPELPRNATTRPLEDRRLWTRNVLVNAKDVPALSPSNHQVPRVPPSHSEYVHWFDSPFHVLYWIRRGMVALDERGIPIAHGLDLQQNHPSSSPSTPTRRELNRPQRATGPDERGLPNKPPSGPRMDRIPSGPRAERMSIGKSRAIAAESWRTRGQGPPSAAPHQGLSYSATPSSGVNSDFDRPISYKVRSLNQIQRDDAFPDSPSGSYSYDRRPGGGTTSRNRGGYGMGRPSSGERGVNRSISPQRGRTQTRERGETEDYTQDSPGRIYSNLERRSVSRNRVSPGYLSEGELPDRGRSRSQHSRSLSPTSREYSLFFARDRSRTISPTTYTRDRTPSRGSSRDSWRRSRSRSRSTVSWRRSRSPRYRYNEPARRGRQISPYRSGDQEDGDAARRPIRRPESRPYYASAYLDEMRPSRSPSPYGARYADPYDDYSPRRYDRSYSPRR
jgi:hypothetical protein